MLQDAIIFKLVLACIPGVLSIVLFFKYDKVKLSILLLLLCAFLLRLVLISLDPFLHDWDERFHALVAKNMMTQPFKPMLRINPILEYDPEAWCCNHIWVHKQPLFLWQMALSMFIFGVNEMAMRLPSAIMGTVMIYFIYEITQFWFQEKKVSFLAAIMLCFSFYQLEMISGRLSLEHNDLAFAFYFSAAIWSFVQYIRKDYNLNWALLTGLLVGCAILIKWLTAFLVFGGWGLYVVLNFYSDQRRTLVLHLLYSFFVCCLIFLPWQIYIHIQFPLETAISYEHNRLHISDVLGSHGGTLSFHYDNMFKIYGDYLLPFGTVGVGSLYYYCKSRFKITLAFLSMIFVIYLFFSFVVATKMPAFCLPVCVLIIPLISLGIVSLVQVFKFLMDSFIGPKLDVFIMISLSLIVAYYVLNPREIVQNRVVENKLREQKIQNTSIYKKLSKIVDDSDVVFMCDDVELMFYQNTNAYFWFPTQEKIDSIKKAGYGIVMFNSHNGNNLPIRITQDPDITILPFDLQ